VDVDNVEVDDTQDSSRWHL